METETPFKIENGVGVLTRPRIVETPGGDLFMYRGFRWNGANIPRCLAWIFGRPFDRVHAMPSAEHDLLYTTHPCTREQADAHYYRGIRARGQWLPLAFLEWLNVRVFGALYWD